MGLKKRVRGNPIFIIPLVLSTLSFALFYNYSASPTDYNLLAAQGGKCTCETTVYDRRSQDQERDVYKKWQQAREFVRNENLSFMSSQLLGYHYKKLNEIEEKGIPGSIFECGVAKAGSSITFAAAKNPNRCLHLFDTFEGIPEPNPERDDKDVIQRYKRIQEEKEKCLRGEPCDKEYYGNMDNLLQYVYNKFEEAGYPPEQHHVSFHKGLFDDTVWPDGPVAYAHLDGDWYDSTMNVLKRISPHLSVGGYFILDDVFSWSGATKAYSDFFDVDLNWLQKQEGKKCYTTVGAKKYLVFLEKKAGAQVLDHDDLSIPRCTNKISSQHP